MDHGGGLEACEFVGGRGAGAEQQWDVGLRGEVSDRRQGVGGARVGDGDVFGGLHHGSADRRGGCGIVRRIDDGVRRSGGGEAGTGALAALGGLLLRRVVAVGAGGENGGGSGGKRAGEDEAPGGEGTKRWVHDAGAFRDAVSVGMGAGH
ncbi:hypothetical protein [Helcobacillus massiliensis]|uniref:Uncharacterized protein n=1 Tax=Helcobacillus massiliensis TaxID=521392 RepID=A0A839QUP3_9MICO|nr:hypothetical protein [Helcobacillus massiliensis]MBB3022500.1 hypothetical protein [Helcobacillus massiliensis]